MSSKIKEFTPTYLYIKQHTITGKLYFGKTIRDPLKYLGSGLYWRRHIRLHGELYVVTLWHELFTDKESFIDFANEFSTRMNIVESNCWANLKPEYGTDGGTEKGHRKGVAVGSKNSFFGKKHKEESKNYGDANPARRPEVRAKMSGPRPGFMPHNHYTGWSDETKKKISASLLGKKQSEETKQKLKKLRKDLIWVFDGVQKPVQIKRHLFEQYQQNGYSRGRGPKNLW